MYIIDIRKNRNSYYDGQLFISINDYDSSDIVVGTWSGILQYRGDRHINYLSLEDFKQIVLNQEWSYANDSKDDVDEFLYSEFNRYYDMHWNEYLKVNDIVSE